MNPYGLPEEVWRQYVADVRAAYGQIWSTVDREYWHEHLTGSGEITVWARIAFFARQRAELADES